MAPVSPEKVESALTFLPQGFTVRVRPGDTILDAALDNGFALPHECGGNCACTTCHVQVLAGGELLSLPEEVETDRLRTAAGWTPDSRLGCQAIVRYSGEIVVFPIEM